MANQNSVKFGDTFYLKHETSGQYLVNVENGRRNWPRLGSQEQRVKLQLVGSQGEEVISDSYIKIRTTEQAALNNNILGAFGDSHDCYYWQDGYDDSKQGWRITKASGNAGPIVYSDRVRITNVYYGNQRLVPDTKYQGYITTVENADDWWILEPTSVQPAKLPNSDNNIDSNQMANNFKFDLPGFQNDFKPGEERLEQLLRSRWNEDVNRLTERILQNEPWNFTNQPALTDYYNPRTTEVPNTAAVVPITWTIYPNRIKFYLPDAGQRKHWQYADNGVPNPMPDQQGPRGWQDEYAEWSVTRNAEGKITKVSFTSETREYWYALWDVAPEIVLRLYKQLISEQVKLEDLYLRDASGNPIIDPQTGRPAYNELNEWNNKSTNGLAHLVATFNSQQGAMFLGAQSTILRTDKQGNPITDASQLINLGLHGTSNRNSDPFISARVNDLVRSGVRVTLKNPIGIYLQEPNFGTYELPFDAPDGAKPSDYWKVIRGRKRQAGETYDLILHAVYEVPPEHGFTVSDISIGGFPIEYGAQIAETLQVAVIGEGIPQQTPPGSYGPVEQVKNVPYPALLREADLLRVAERSNLNMRIKQGTTIENVALKARNSDRDATIEFVGAPGITVKKTDFREEIDSQNPEKKSQIFTLTLTAAADAPPGNRALLLKNSNGACGPARFGMLEVVPSVKQWVLTTDGRDDCVEIKDPFVNTTDFTISLWIKPAMLNDGGWHGFIGKQGDTYRKPSLWQAPANNGLHYDSFDASGQRYADQLNNFFVAKDQWVHIAWVKEKTEYKFYRNGELFATKIAPASFYTNRDTNYWIGRVDNFFFGQISDVRIWSRARKIDEIKGDMNQRLSGNEPGLVGYWPLNDCSGSIVVDKSSTGNNGTIHGGPWQQQELPIIVCPELVASGAVGLSNGEFYTTDGNGNLSLLKKHTGWNQTWQFIVPGNFGGNSYTGLLFDGLTTVGARVREVYTTDGSGNLSLLSNYIGGSTTKHLIVPGNFGGNSYTSLLYYIPNPQDLPNTQDELQPPIPPIIEFYLTDGNGNIQPFGRSIGSRKTWQLIVPGNFGGNSYTDLLFYDPTTGESEFHTTDGRGNLSLLKKNTGWRKTWKLIVPGNFGENSYTDLLFYDPTTGEIEFHTTDGNGYFWLLKAHTGWRKTWKLIVPGNFGGNSYTDLLFYDPTTGEAEFYTTDGSGNLSLLKKHTGWSKTIELIVPGEFGGSSYTDLFFYNSIH